MCVRVGGKEWKWYFKEIYLINILNIKLWFVSEYKDKKGVVGYEHLK